MPATVEREFRWGGELVAYVEHGRLCNCAYHMNADVAREYARWLVAALGGTVELGEVIEQKGTDDDGPD